MPNAIFVAENMASTKLDSLLASGRFQASGVNAAINNGNLVALGAKDATQREVYICTAPAAATTPVYIVDGVEMQYSQETTQGLNNYTNPAGALLRLRRPQVGDHFAISARAITALGSVPVVGNVVVTQAAATTWNELAAPAGGESVVGTIEESYVLGADPLGGRNITMYVIRITSVI